MKKSINSETFYFPLLQQGDSSALYYLIRVYAPVLCGYARRIMDDESAIEDIVEETFLKLWDRHASFESFISVKTFLYLTVRNASLNFIRDRKRERLKHAAYSELQLTESATDEVLYAELLAHIRKAIDELPEKMRQIFILSYIEQFSNQEVADKLSLSNQTVRNQKAKALQILRNKLKLHSGIPFLCLPLVTILQDQIKS